MVEIEKIKFARTTWANIQLAKLCPGNDISKLNEIIETNDFVKQMDTMVSVVLILKESYDRRERYFNKDYKAPALTKEDLEMMNEDELLDLFNNSLEVFSRDGETTIETKTKKTKNAKSPSSSMKRG